MRKKNLILEDMVYGAAVPNAMNFAGAVEFDGAPLYFRERGGDEKLAQEPAQEPIHTTDSSIHERSDFTDTVYWSRGDFTNNNGELKLSFRLSDSITLFRVQIEALSNYGAIGWYRDQIVSAKHFFVEAKIPTTVTDGDELLVPVGIIANLDAEMIKNAPLNMRANIEAKWTYGLIHKDGQSKLNTVIDMPKNQRTTRWTFPLIASLDRKSQTNQPIETKKSTNQPIDQIEKQFTNLSIIASLSIGSNKDEFRDQSKLSMRVVNRGFPFTLSSGGFVSIEKSGSGKFSIPSNAYPGSISIQIQAYPSPVASLLQALKSLIQEPCGCFEQTSATLYPLIMAQQYFQTHEVRDNSLFFEVQRILSKGFEKLTSFEVKGGGFDWFGEHPAHEALSAYAVHEFIDLSKVFLVPENLIHRTKEWLMNQKESLAKFRRNSRALDSFGSAPEDITNAYIIYSLVEAGIPGLEDDVERLFQSVKNSTPDPYLLTLVANSLSSINRMKDASILMKIVEKFLKPGHGIEGAKTSITCSGGQSLMIETTSLAAIAWMKIQDPKDYIHIDQAIRWIISQCTNGRFGSTQGTVLALKAIIMFDKMNANRIPFQLQLLHNEVIVATTNQIDASQSESNVIDFDISELTSTFQKDSDHTFELVMKSTKKDIKNEKTAIPFSMTMTYYAPSAPSAINSPISFSIRQSIDKGYEGDPIGLKFKIANTGNSGLPMIVAVIGLPASLQPSFDRLQDLRKSKLISFFELRDNDIILYWRGMAPNQKIEFVIDTIAIYPGNYCGQSSRAYLYYNEETKIWQESICVNILPSQ